MSYEIAKFIVTEVERIIVGKQPAHKLIDFFRRELVYPFKLLFRGWLIWYRDFVKFSFLSLISMLFIIWFSSRLPQESASIFINFFVPLVWLISLVASMFSAPTSFGFCGVKNDHIDPVVDILRKKAVTTKQLSAIQGNIDLFEKRVKTRVVGLRAVLILCWSGFIYLFSSFTTSIVDLKNLPPIADFFPLGISLFLVLALYVAIESYAKINTLIFGSSQIGCNEYSFIVVIEGACEK